MEKGVPYAAGIQCLVRGSHLSEPTPLYWSDYCLFPEILHYSGKKIEISVILYKTRNVTQLYDKRIQESMRHVRLQKHL